MNRTLWTPTFNSQTCTREGETYKPPNTHLRWGYNTNRRGHRGICGEEKFTKNRNEVQVWQRTDFRRAIQLAPDVPFPKEALASLLATENRALAEALTLAEIAVKSEDQPTHRATLAFVYYRLNRVPDARREIETAFAQAPKHPYILRIRSEILKADP